jgi:hypothetical protein
VVWSGQETVGSERLPCTAGGDKSFRAHDVLQDLLHGVRMVAMSLLSRGHDYRLGQRAVSCLACYGGRHVASKEVEGPKWTDSEHKDDFNFLEK